MEMEGMRISPLRGRKSPPLWSLLTRMAVMTVLLLPSTCCARQHLLSASDKVLPGSLIDYQITDASSSCACRVMCIRNTSCSGIAVQDDGGQLTCAFSHDEVQAEDLIQESGAFTWLFEASASTITTITTSPPATTTTVTPPTTTAVTTTPTTVSTTLTPPTTLSTSSTITTPTTTSTTTTPTTIPTTTSTITTPPTTSTTTTPTTTSTTTTPTTTTTATKTCPSYYETFEDSCYYFHCEYFKKTWHQARDICNNYGSDLVKITSDSENQFLKDRIAASSRSHWIGLNDVDYEGDFKWSVDGSSLGTNYSKWDSGIPADSDMDCIKMGSDGKWYGDYCGEYRCHICERQPV